MIEKASSIHINEMVKLWNQQHWIYEKIDSETMFSWIQNENNISLIETKDHILVGLVFGNIDVSKHKAYLSMIIVEQNVRRLGIGSQLFHTWKEEIIKQDAFVDSIEIVFFDPNQFRWKLSGLNDVVHPNSPGVHIEQNVPDFFLHLGFKEYARQEVYYQDITHFQLKMEVQDKLNQLLEQELSICFYDPEIHQGFEDFFKRTHYEHWYLAAIQGIQKGWPVLVLLDHTQVIGFTGPLSVETSGRGYFAGIGIDQNYQGKGYGTLLFNQLCLELSNLGASYMTLFTGTNNPARFVYLNAGFRVTDTFMNVRYLIK